MSDKREYFITNTADIPDELGESAAELMQGLTAFVWEIATLAARAEFKNQADPIEPQSIRA